MENLLSEYSLGERIHQSARTIVYRATRLSDRTPCIVKTSQKEHPPPNELARFRREYELLRLLPVDGVVKLYEFTRYKSRVALVMEDFGGTAVGERLESGPLPVDDVLGIGIQVARALGRIHQRRVVHKDINPSNVAQNPETGQVKLIDFSIATLLSRETPSIRNPGVIEGTVLYMSPEQTGRVNRAIDFRTDLYSLGATLYELLAGVPPFQLDDTLALIHAHIAVEPTPLHERAPHVPRALSDVVKKLLSKTAEQRHQSAHGVAHDLEAIRAGLRVPGSLEGFVPGRHDVSTEFRIPQKLYGRERDAAMLEATWSRVARSSTELLLVTGYSGIGKSSLVNEIHRPLVSTRGHFTSGKFEELRRNVPYAPIIDAFQELVRQLLAESDVQLAAWRRKISEALGSNASVITELFPALELILGRQPAATPLAPTEALNRFHYTFQRFVRALATATHPLVVYLDDLQWADLPSLNLIQRLLSDPELRYVCIIGAYRDNEISGTHPLTSLIEAVREAGTRITTVKLEPLGIDHIVELIDDSIHCGAERAKPLAALLLQKTEGNPFYLHQLLSSLVGDGLVEFDPEAGTYTWDLDEIRSRGLTRDVLELMVTKIQRLSPTAQNALELAACIGNRFDLRTLSSVLAASATETAKALRQAIDDGLLVPQYDMFTMEAALQIEELEDTAHGAAFRFLHDRVQQAAYQLVDEESRSSIHVRLGRLLLSRAPEASLDDRVFEIVNQYMLGIDGIALREERLRVADLALRAARRAKVSAALEPALRYALTGIRLLPSDAFTDAHDLAQALYTEGAEIEYLNAHMDGAKELADVALRHARTMLERVKVLETRMLFNLSRNRFEDTIRDGLEALSLLGVHLPADATQTHFVEALAQNRSLLEGRPIAALVDLPEMTDPAHVEAQRILALLGAPSKSTNPALFLVVACEQLRHSILHGNSRYAPIAYATYGTLHASVLGDADGALAWGDLAAKVLDRLGAREAKCNVYLLLAVLIQPWKVHLRETLPLLRDGLAAGIDTADLQLAGHCASNLATSPFFAGISLDAVREQQARSAEFLIRVKHDMLRLYVGIAEQTVQNLVGKSADPRRLAGDAFDEEQASVLASAKNFSTLCLLFAMKTMLSYFFGDYEAAVRFAEEAEANRRPAIGHPMLIVQNFYQSLALIARAAEIDPPARGAMLSKVAENQAVMRRWADDAPVNFLHKWQLVEAERARLEGRVADAVALYEGAIRNAAEQQFIQDEALACERAAEACRALGWERAADAYLDDAHYAYLRWGAHAKVAWLEDRHPDKLEGRAAMSARQTSDALRPHQSTSETEDILELGSVMKAAQAISSEIVLDRLVQSLLRIMLENAGAQHGFFLLESDGRLIIEGECTSDGTEVLTRGAELTAEDPRLSAAIANYVARTGESIVLSNAAASDRFTNDPYVAQNRPKSVLCAPLTNQGRLVGLIYLENNLTEGAFTASRLELLRLLSGQAALSIHNATLYATLEQKVQERTRELYEKNEELRRTQRQLVVQEKLASLGTLTAGIAHELKNPLNFINNFANLSIQLVADLSADLEDQRAALDPLTLENIDETLSYLQQNVKKIEAHGKRADRIISSMLQHSRNTVGERGPMDLNAVVAESVTLGVQSMKNREPGFGIDVVTSYDRSIGSIDAVAGDVSRVFLSLIENGCYAMAQKKRAQGTTYRPELRITTKDEGDSVDITIRDNGTGIRPDAVDKIFTPFFTTKPPGEGTGLGLSLSHDIIVDAHRGTMSVDTKPGEFTEFRVRLPKKLSARA